MLGREETDGPSGATHQLSADLTLDDPLRKEILLKVVNENDNIRFSDFVFFSASIGKFRSIRNTKEGLFNLWDIFFSSQQHYFYRVLFFNNFLPFRNLVHTDNL